MQNNLTDRAVRLIVVGGKLAGLRNFSDIERRGGRGRRGVEVNLRDKRLECEGEECKQRDRKPANARALRFYI